MTAITWERPPAKTLLLAVLDELPNHPSKWACLRVCPSNNAARHTKWRLVKQIEALALSIRFEVVVRGVKVYGRCKGRK